jgi:signal transduction histidine kinase
METTELRALALFDGLSDDRLARMISSGEERKFTVGEELFVEGRPALTWWLLLDGAIELSRRTGHEDTVVGMMETPGQWAGGFQAWDEHGVYLATGRGARPGRLLVVSAAALGELAQDWFPFGVHIIRGLVGTVRNIETMARQREALVALGTLAAGLAHEINNPASAATRAVDALGQTSGYLLDSLAQLAAHGISAEQFTGLDKLRLELAPGTAAGDPLALADREDALADWMAGQGVGREWLFAPTLAAAGADLDWCRRVGDLLGPDPLEAGLAWVSSAVGSLGLLAEVKESTGRISELVAAVRSYSQLDRASVQVVDLREGLDSTLVMLRPKLAGVEVVREYDDDLPRIEAIPGELNQVWTNLIDNAVDAMSGQGRLEIAVRADGGGAVVEVRDSGAGMPAEVQARAFEPFFTTKDVGSGTGLGLDISRRIVVGRHGGDIAIDSEPGRTVVRVRLAARPPTTRR